MERLDPVDASSGHAHAYARWSLSALLHGRWLVDVSAPCGSSPSLWRRWFGAASGASSAAAPFHNPPPPSAERV